MRAPYTKLYVHLVWATWDRAPLLGGVEENMARVIGAKTAELGCQALSIGGDLDHIHLLARLSTTISIATLVGEVKGSASHWANFVWRPDYTFRWQGSYGAFSVSPNAISKVEAYIRNQKEHHAARELWLEWEQCFLPDPI